MKKILVMGGAGFVGSNLYKVLVKNPENQVYSLDNYFTGSRENHIPKELLTSKEIPNIFLN